jgi:hypothetical protein
MITRKLLSAALVAAAFALTVGSVEATIERIDFCGANFSRTQAIPLPKTTGGWYSVVVRGDWVDTITGVTADQGITVGIGQKTGGGGTNTSVQLNLGIRDAAVGRHTIRLNYVAELGAPDQFIIDVRRFWVDNISKDVAGDHILTDTLLTFTVSGTGLSDLVLDAESQSHFTNYTEVSHSNTTFVFRGNAQSIVSLSRFSFHNRNTCGQVTLVFPTGEGSLTYMVGRPDLVVSKALRVYRLLQQGTCNGRSFATTKPGFCTELAGALPNPTRKNPHIERVRNIGGIMYLVVNPTDFPITAPFRVQLKNGINTLKEDTVDGLRARGRKVLGYSRPDGNSRKLMRDIHCPDCYDLQEPPYDWSDPVYTTIVDEGGQITEQDETNNQAQSD